MSRKRKAGCESEIVCESWSRTEQYKVKGRHMWTIDDFMRRASSTEVGDSLCSPVFSVAVEGFDGEIQNLTFQLEVFPNGEEGEDNSDYVAVFLTSRRQEDLEVKYDFSVQKVDGTCWGRIGNTFKKFSPEQNSWGYGKAFSKQKLMEKTNELLPNGRLTIVCNLEIYYSDRHTEGKKQKVEFRTDDAPSLGDNMEMAFNATTFSDVQLVCETRKFDCHKVILSSRSEVFEAMFSHKETTENTNNEVVITDIEPDVLEQLLRFIYSDKVDNLSIFAGSLLTASDKYNIPRLKAICEETMCDNLDVSNAAEVLGLAYLHEAKTLQSIAVEFVTTNMVKVSETAGWKTITESHPKILNEVLMSLTAKLKK
eukprot:snap_masked-scaffold671_size114370-processed-gene-0.10 protein:Tk06020 transcript:snap_masked-scaffold671_size114370-processed-gene-0.10-mRNA-1 annotation:"protein roadkill isoform x4"